MKALLVIEHDGQMLHPQTAALVTAAKKLDEMPHCLVIGHNCQMIAEAVSKFEGVGRVLCLDAPHYGSYLAQTLSPVVAAFDAEYDAFLAISTTFSKTLMPAVAARLNVSQVTDVVDILSEDTFVHPIYAGNALETLQVLDEKKVLLIRGTAFQKATQGVTLAPIISKDGVPPLKNITLVSKTHIAQERPDLGAAKIVVSGGRGLQSAEKFHLIQELADCLGAAVGATRAAVDAGFITNEYQVGQTGRIIAPDLYIAIGISGAVQHLAGMKESKMIVAINRDEDAPIFQIADYGLVGDLFEIVPELIVLLQEKK